MRLQPSTVLCSIAVLTGLLMSGPPLRAQAVFTPKELLAALEECDQVEDFAIANPSSVLKVCDLVLEAKPAGLDKSLGKVYQLRGDAQLMCLTLPEGIESYRKAVLHGSTNAQAILFVSLADKPLPPNAAVDQVVERYTQAIKAAGRDKSVAGLYGELAKFSELAGQRDRADEFLRLGHERNRDDGWLVQTECFVLTLRGKGQGAVALADRFVEKSPNSRFASIVLARKAEALLTLGQPKEAMHAALTANKVCRWPGQLPDKVDAFHALARAYLTLDKPATALYAAVEACKIHKDSLTGQLVQAAALCRLNRPEEALASAKRAVELAPTDVRSFTALGDVHKILGQDDAALKNYTKAVQIDPKYVPALVRCAVLLGTSSVAGVADPKRAADLMTQGITDAGSFDAIRWRLARAVTAANGKNVELAVAEMSEATRILARLGENTQPPFACANISMRGSVKIIAEEVSAKQSPVIQIYRLFEYILD